MASNGLHELIKKHALKNAMDYGKADPSIVLNKTIAAAKKEGVEIPQLRAEIESIVNEVNSMSRDELELYEELDMVIMGESV